MRGGRGRGRLSTLGLGSVWYRVHTGGPVPRLGLLCLSLVLGHPGAAQHLLDLPHGVLAAMVLHLAFLGLALGSCTTVHGARGGTTPRLLATPGPAPLPAVLVLLVSAAPGPLPTVLPCAVSRP